MAREIKQWITINGVHVPIFEGQSKDEAVKSYIKDKEKGTSSSGIVLKDDITEPQKGDSFKDSKGHTIHVKGYRGRNVQYTVTDKNGKESDIKQSGVMTFKKMIHEKGYSQSDNKKAEVSAQIDKDEKTKQEQISKNEEQKKRLNGEKSARQQFEEAKEDYRTKSPLETHKAMMEDAMKADWNTGSSIREFMKKYDLGSDNEAQDIMRAIRQGREWQTIYSQYHNENYFKPKDNSAITGSGKEIDKARAAVNKALEDTQKYVNRPDVNKAQAEQAMMNTKIAAEAVLKNAQENAKAEAIREAYEKQKSNKGTTYEVMEKDGKYVVVGGNNNGRDDPGSWHSKREDRLDRGYKPLPDSDYEKWRKDNDVSKTSTSYSSGDDKFKQDLKNLTTENLRAVHDNHNKAWANVKTPEQKEWWDRTAKAIMDEEKRRNNNDISRTGSGKVVDSERTSKKVSNSYQEGTYKVTENKDKSEFIVRDGNGRIIGRVETSKEATRLINQHKEAKLRVKEINSQIVRLHEEVRKYKAEVRNTDNNHIRQNNLSDAQHKLKELFEKLKKWEKFLE